MSFEKINLEIDPTEFEVGSVVIHDKFFILLVSKYSGLVLISLDEGKSFLQLARPEFELFFGEISIVGDFA